jgi:hypothetical protein
LHKGYIPDGVIGVPPRDVRFEVRLKKDACDGVKRLFFFFAARVSFAEWLGMDL